MLGFSLKKSDAPRVELSKEKIPAYKLSAMQYVIVLVLLTLAAGVWRLGIANNEEYSALAEQNRIRKVPILAPRGKILDRDGRLIVDNYPSTSAFLLREQVKDPDTDYAMIAKGLNITPDYIESVVKKYEAKPKYEPLPLKQDLTPDEVAFIEAHRNELPELETIDEQRRLYPRNGFAAHLIGYVGEVSDEMLNDPKYEFYEPGDVVGKSGVEQSYDYMLRGKDGSRDVVVNSHGKEIGQLGREPSVPGESLKLTIDLDIQEAAERALGNRNGAMIAMDPRNGEILAMVSRPVFDPNEFSVRIKSKQWNALLTDPDHPLLNKSIQAQLAPGSTFKIIMSVAGLQEGVAQNMHVSCGGGASFFGHYFKCDKAHGMVDIYHAIPWSCDTFYYTLANRLGIETIAKYAHEMGLGRKTGIDLPNEAVGTVPSEEWKMKNYHEKWYAGETISVGIGQGAVAATPIQLARALSGIASGGVLKRPHVVFEDQRPKNFSELWPGSGDVTVPLNTANWEIISNGMAGALDPKMGGTAGASHLEGIDFAGKTGTAQVISHEGAARTGAHGKKTQPNSWFVGMVPRRNPEIVVAVLWENGDWGSNSAKLAAQVITAYVNKQRHLQDNARMEAPKPAPSAPASATAVPAHAPAARPRTDGSDTVPTASVTRRKRGDAEDTTEMAGFWSTDQKGGYQAGRFRLSSLSRKNGFAAGHDSSDDARAKAQKEHGLSRATQGEESRASAPEVLASLNACDEQATRKPQRLKPCFSKAASGTAVAVPLAQRLKPPGSTQDFGMADPSPHTPKSRRGAADAVPLQRKLRRDAADAVPLQRKPSRGDESISAPPAAILHSEEESEGGA